MHGAIPWAILKANTFQSISYVCSILAIYRSICKPSIKYLTLIIFSSVIITSNSIGLAKGPTEKETVLRPLWKFKPHPLMSPSLCGVMGGVVFWAKDQSDSPPWLVKLWIWLHWLLNGWRSAELNWSGQWVEKDNSHTGYPSPLKSPALEISWMDINLNIS